MKIQIKHQKKKRLRYKSDFRMFRQRQRALMKKVEIMQAERQKLKKNKKEVYDINQKHYIEMKNTLDGFISRFDITKKRMSLKICH